MKKTPFRGKESDVLVLTRKNGQKLMIGDDIEIVIIESSNNSVKIGINAPKNVSVYREEIYNEIKNINKTSNDAANFDAIDLLMDILKNPKTTTTSAKLNSVTTKVKIVES